MIFPLVWRILPGPASLRVVLLLALLAGALCGLFTFVFPWVAADVLPPPDGAVDAEPSPTGAAG